jgi:hypothetical protein
MQGMHQSNNVRESRSVTYGFGILSLSLVDMGRVRLLHRASKFLESLGIHLQTLRTSGGRSGCESSIFTAKGEIKVRRMIQAIEMQAHLSNFQELRISTPLIKSCRK